MVYTRSRVLSGEKVSAGERGRNRPCRPLVLTSRRQEIAAVPRAATPPLLLAPFLFAPLLLALPLAGCGSGAAPASAPANTATPADDYVARMRALAPGQRDGVLLRAIRDAGRDCQQVVKSQSIDDVGGAPAWAATCDGGGVWVVALNPGGVATVTAAADMTKAQGR